MGIYIGTQKIDHIYKGTTELSKTRIGEEMTSLIEGDDFVRAKWLCGRNGAYINTEHLVKTYEDAFEVYARYDGTVKNPDGEEQDMFGINSNNIILVAYITSGNNINAVIKENENTGNYGIGVHKEVFRLTLYAPNSSEYVKTLDGISYTNPIGGTVSNDTNLKMYVFTRNGFTNRYFHGDISHFRITDPTFSIDRVNMTPVRLLHAIPSTFDANGIARNADECGMYDSISGLFYGNVGSGSFSVTNE